MEHAMVRGGELLGVIAILGGREKSHTKRETPGIRAGLRIKRIYHDAGTQQRPIHTVASRYLKLPVVALIFLPCADQTSA